MTLTSFQYGNVGTGSSYTYPSYNIGISAYSGYLIAAIVIGIIAGIVVAWYLNKNKKFGLVKGRFYSVLFWSLLVEIAASIYLLATDANLQKYSQVHWYALLVFAFVDIVLIELYLMHAGKTKPMYMAIAGWSLIGFLAVLLDAVLALPLSQFAGKIGSPEGFQYLFGFGSYGSTVGMSTAVTLILVFSLVSLVMSLYTLKKKKL
ncbi:hypothetical protein M1293_02260 [Candidatus Parvarchaeota archaeon]|nr:hypothetical protein [Candidatus Parvarchaeota archaeon]